jgi:hypothetical protein
MNQKFQFDFKKLTFSDPLPLSGSWSLADAVQMWNNLFGMLAKGGKEKREAREAGEGRRGLIISPRPLARSGYFVHTKKTRRRSDTCHL